MKYTYQTTSEGGSFAPPYGDDVEHANNMPELAAALEEWAREHDRVGADPRQARLIIWRGDLDDVTDIYPDFIAATGPRGGTHLSPC